MRRTFRGLIGVLLLLGLLSYPAAPLAAQGDWLEPNNTFGTAAPIAATATVQETIFPRGDIDWLWFTVDTHGELQVEITNVAPELGIRVRVWNTDSRVVGDWVGPLARGGDTNAVFDLPSVGRYTLEIRDTGDSAESLAPYQLTTLFTPAVDTGEPNNSFSSATPLTFATPLQATILPRGDVDFYRFEVDRHGELQIAVTDVPENMDIIFRVWDDGVNAISGWFAPLAKGGNTLATFDLPAPGLYVLEVRDKDDNDRSVAPYTLQVDFTPALDPFEPNNEFRHAKPLTSGVAVEANILPRYDVDWYELTVDHHGELTVLITQVNEELDITFRIWNADRQAISGWFNPLAKGGDTEGVFDLSGPGIYRLEVRDKDDNARSIEPYRLEATFIPAIDPYEPNNSFGKATEIAADQTLQANILPRGDSDWYAMRIPFHGELQVLVSNVPSEMDIAFRLWNAELQTVSSWIVPLAKGGNTEGFIDLAQAGFYWLEVRDNGDNDRSIDPYTLTTRFLTSLDLREPNNAIELATTVDLDTTIAGNILPVRDIDWYAVDITTAGELHVLVTNVAPELDIAFRLWTEARSTVSSWVISPDLGDDAEAVIAIAEPGVYLLELRDNGDNARSIQPYLLHMSMQPIDPDDITMPTVQVPEPLVTAPPTDAPPVDEPPTEEPPTQELPTQEPPTEEPPTAEGNGPSETPPPATITPPLAPSDAQVSVAAEIGPAGGELVVEEPQDPAVNGVRLEIPSDLLDEATTVTLFTSDTPRPDGEVALFPAGHYWDVSPAGLRFDEPVTVAFPAPPGLATDEMFIARWSGDEWLDLGGQMQNGMFSAETTDLSTLALFCGSFMDYRDVAVRNDTGSPAITLTYVAGPAPDPDAIDATSFGCPPPSLTEYAWEIAQGEEAGLLLRPGFYRFTVDDPAAASLQHLLLKVPPDQLPFVISITEDAATTQDSEVEILYAPDQADDGTALWPTATGTAIVPDGVESRSAMPGLDPDVDPMSALGTLHVFVGPMGVDQMAPRGPGITFSPMAFNSDATPLRGLWTVSDGRSHRVVSIDDVAPATLIADATRFRPRTPGLYTLFLTVYDDLGRFDQVRWEVEVTATAP